MKKVLILLIFISSFISNAFSQSNSLSYLKQVLYKAAVTAALYSYYYTFEDNSNLIGAFLEKGKDINISYNMKAFNDYIIIGVADEDVKDLDLTLYDNNWKQLEKDSRTDNVPIIEYSCYRSGEYIVNLKNYNSVRPSFCVFFVLKKGSDYNNTIKKFAEAVDNILLVSAIIQSTGADFIRNCICVFGGSYNKGESDYFGNFDVPYSGKYVYFGIGSNNIDDLDIVLYEQLNYSDPLDQTIKLTSDYDNSRIAIVDYYLYSYKSYKLYYKNYKSSGKGYIICVVMKL